MQVTLTRPGELERVFLQIASLTACAYGIAAALYLEIDRPQGCALALIAGVHSGHVVKEIQIARN